MHARAEPMRRLLPVSLHQPQAVQPAGQGSGAFARGSGRGLSAHDVCRNTRGGRTSACQLPAQVVHSIIPRSRALISSSMVSGPQSNPSSLAPFPAIPLPRGHPFTCLPARCESFAELAKMMTPFPFSTNIATLPRGAAPPSFDLDNDID